MKKLLVLRIVCWPSVKPFNRRLLAAITTLVEHLPDYGAVALAEKAEELECPMEAAIEMAFTQCL
jgi:hypothetical protein